MAEVIGDDLNAFIKTSKEKGSVPQEFDVPFAHTPAFVGSHVTGYDNVMKGILEHFWNGKAGTAPKLERAPNEQDQLHRRLRRLHRRQPARDQADLQPDGCEHTILGDTSDVWDTPTDGEFRMYDGGTTLEDAADAVHAKATISMQQYCTEKTLTFIAAHGQEVVAFNHPVGVAGTDRVPDGSLAPQRQADSRGARSASAAGSSTRLPTRVRTSTARSSRSTAIRTCASGWPASCWNSARSRPTSSRPTATTTGRCGCRRCWTASPFGKSCHVYAGKDLWHMRSLLFTEPVDFLIGNTYGKYLERDTGTPLIRIGFPVFDRHHHHRYPVWGYQGGMNVLVRILDKIFDEIDRNSNIPAKNDFSFDIIR